MAKHTTRCQAKLMGAVGGDRRQAYEEYSSMSIWHTNRKGKHTPLKSESGDYYQP